MVNYDKNIQGAKLEARQKAYQEKMRAREEKEKLKWEERKTKKAEKEQLLLEKTVRDLDSAEEQAYGPAFLGLCDDEEEDDDGSVDPSNPGLLKFLAERSALSGTGEFAAALRDATSAHLPEAPRLRLEGFLSLLRRHATSSLACQESFNQTSTGGAEAISQEEAKAHALFLAQKEVDIQLTKEKWYVLVNAVFEQLLGATDVVAYEAYVSCCYLLARAARVLEFMQLSMDADGAPETIWTATPRARKAPASLVTVGPEWQQLASEVRLHLFPPKAGEAGPAPDDKPAQADAFDEEPCGPEGSEAPPEPEGAANEVRPECKDAVVGRDPSPSRPSLEQSIPSGETGPEILPGLETSKSASALSTPRVLETSTGATVQSHLEASSGGSAPSVPRTLETSVGDAAQNDLEAPSGGSAPSAQRASEASADKIAQSDLRASNGANADSAPRARETFAIAVGQSPLESSNAANRLAMLGASETSASDNFVGGRVEPQGERQRTIGDQGAETSKSAQSSGKSGSRHCAFCLAKGGPCSYHSGGAAPRSSGAALAPARTAVAPSGMPQAAQGAQPTATMRCDLCKITPSGRCAHHRTATPAALAPSLVQRQAPSVACEAAAGTEGDSDGDAAVPATSSSSAPVEAEAPRGSSGDAASEDLSAEPTADPGAAHDPDVPPWDAALDAIAAALLARDAARLEDCICEATELGAPEDILVPAFEVLQQFWVLAR